MPQNSLLTRIIILSCQHSQSNFIFCVCTIPTWKIVEDAGKQMIQVNSHCLHFLQLGYEKKPQPNHKKSIFLVLYHLL